MGDWGIWVGGLSDWVEGLGIGLGDCVGGLEDWLWGLGGWVQGWETGQARGDFVEVSG